MGSPSVQHVARVYEAPGPVLESFLEEEAFDVALKRGMGFSGRSGTGRSRIQKIRGDPVKKRYCLVYGIGPVRGDFALV